jgi:serine/threonine-protein kinase
MPDLRERIQDAFGGRLVVERELGGGGMSRVFLASATSVRRRVVVKVLPPDLSVGVNAERFRREIDLAAQLQHPHIVPLLEVGQGEDLLCYTMPYIEGESLRARLGREHGLPIAEAIRLWREVLDALSYAHARGVVHRDIKPENVLLSGKHAVVTDFGVARALGQSTAGGPRSTSTGVSIGTPLYMAPEQAAGDPDVDHRADLYAAALVMWELVAGRHPFAGLAPSEVVASQVTRMPASLTEVRPSVPPALAALVERCLAKHPGDRPASADEVIRAIDALPITDPGRVTPPIASANARRRVIGGVLALVVLAAVTVLVVRRGGAGEAAAVSPEDAAVADSIAAAAEEQFRAVAFLAVPGPPGDEPLRRQALEIVMEVFRRDTTLFVANPAQITAMMRVIRIPERYVADPDSQAAVVSQLAHGSIQVALSRFGGSFTVSASVTRHDRGGLIAGFTADAPDSASLPGSLRRVADSAYRAFKRVAGELQRPGGSRFGSPAAVKLLEDANRRRAAGDYVAAAHLARAATRADSTLAMAWRVLAVSLSNAGINRAEQLDAISRAYRLRSRMDLGSEAILRIDYWRALNRPVEALAAADSLAVVSARFAGSLGPLNWDNNIGLIWERQREFAVAERLFRQAIANTRGPRFWVAHGNLIGVLLDQGKLTGADSLVRVIVSADSTSSWARTALLLRAAAMHDHEALARIAEGVLAGADTTASARIQSYGALRNARLMQGRFREADSIMEIQEQVYVQIGDRRTALITALDRARLHASLRDDTVQARSILEEALSRYPPAAMAFMDRPYEGLIGTWQAVGDLARARALATEWDRNVPAEYRNIDAVLIENAVGDVVLFEGRVDEALRRYRARSSGACFTCDLPDIARAFHLLGRTDSAIVYYERYVSTPNTGRASTDAFHLAEAYLRLGELYESRGEARKAIERYEQLVELWKNADPDRQPVVAEVRASIRRLRTRIG